MSEKRIWNKIGYTAFNELKARVKFLDYEELVKQYEQTIERLSFNTLL